MRKSPCVYFGIRLKPFHAVDGGQSGLLETLIQTPSSRPEGPVPAGVRARRPRLQRSQKRDERLLVLSGQL
jgi:hypothetical protein